MVNALSVDNLSGRHVLLGHLAQMAQLATRVARITVLHNDRNRDLRRDLGNHVDWHGCPASTGHWAGRFLWERTRLPGLLRRIGADLLFSPAGTVTAGTPVPQLVLAQNPWCLLPALHCGARERVKAVLQRAAYRRAQRDAAVMLFNSPYMERAYRANAGHAPQRSCLLHQGVGQETFVAARSAPDFAARSTTLLTVSVMARHKAVEDVVDALALLRRQGIAASLDLVGPWPDPGYRMEIERRVAERELHHAVKIHGSVESDALHRHYANARVFCLLSRCESFGIPAVEAQAFGTPTVVADCCAPPEIAGPGGVCTPPGDALAAAAALAPLLTDEGHWNAQSSRARANAERFRWPACSQPLVDLLQSWAPAV